MHYLTVVSIMCKTNVYSQVRKHVIKVLPVRFLLEIYRIWRFSYCYLDSFNIFYKDSNQIKSIVFSSSTLII